MINCTTLTHPFQNDPGCSQSQRVMESLLNGSAKIDGRTLADLLNYFKELSQHIKYSWAGTGKNTNTAVLQEDSWETFFSGNSIPFLLAAVTKNNAASVSEKWQLYNHLFSKGPTEKALQLLIYFFYYNTIYKINKLYADIRASDLPLVLVLEQEIKNKLQSPVNAFVKAAYTAHKVAGIKCIDFSSLADVWNINPDRTSSGDQDISAMDTGLQQQLFALRAVIENTVNPVLHSMDTIAGAASAALPDSLTAMQQKHSPHLALLFTFLSLFSNLQKDLNGFTKKHLDFFYKDVLQIKPAPAQSDSVHIVFELQKQLKQYALKKGLLIKADKDNNNTEIDFGIDNDIVVDKTQVADLRTLFMNNQSIYRNVFVEGTYMATKANTADGIGKDFTADPKNFPTVGARFSKYTAPGKAIPEKYPSARIGFVLASPVLLLNEGERTISITLQCHLNNNCQGKAKSLVVSADSCCKQVTAQTEAKISAPFIDSAKLFDDVKAALDRVNIYVSSTLIDEAVKQGLSLTSAGLIYDNFLKGKSKGNVFCKDAGKDQIAVDTVIEKSQWDAFLAEKKFTSGELSFLAGVFKPVRPFRVLFSGEKDWIDPSSALPAADNNSTTFNPLSVGMSGSATSFKITIESTIGGEMDAITFYNKDVLKEDLGSTQPLAKIELNDSIKLPLKEEFLNSPDKLCCVEKKTGIERQYISLYHFFRDVVIDDSSIQVKVCGLKNFVVQNDESVQDVNSPVYPFGTRPAIIDFDAVNAVANQDPDKDENGDTPTRKNNPAPEKNLIGSNFYLGSGEVFSKKWDQVCVNLNWKDKPKDFNEHYKAYLKRNDILDCNGNSPENGVYGLNECDFEVNLSILNKGSWVKEKSSSNKGKTNPVTNDYNRKLFPAGPACKTGCLRSADDKFEYSFFIEASDFCNMSEAGAENISRTGNVVACVTGDFNDNLTGLKKYDTTARKGFFRFTLQNQDFLHKDYAFVLARQMMALGRFPDVILENAVYADGDTVVVYKNLGRSLGSFQQSVEDTDKSAKTMYDKAKKLLDDYEAAIRPDGSDPNSGSIDDNEQNQLTPEVRQNERQAKKTLKNAATIKAQMTSIIDFLKLFDKGEPIKKFSVLIPNEPWTPVISNIALDYTATAEKEDISLIHLYPYKDTYREEQLSLTPSLLPVFCDEGSLFVGLSDVPAGENVNLLFEMAGATSDTESGFQPVSWQYLYNNTWLDLRKGFEILDDETRNLTGSGIIQFSLPDNISLANTVMPSGLYWIKASVDQNSRAVCETTAIYTQAVKASFVIAPMNDTGRLSSPLKENSISKLKTPDANIKQVSQPFPSFGGRQPEETNHFYTRVSELLRHKGRGVQKFDYERLVLEAFPQVFKTKCINHSFFLDGNRYDNDFPIAPGYVMIAVIPDLTKLASGHSFEPKLPAQLIEDIQEYLSARISPFVKVKAVNPRYEKIHIRLSVILRQGYDKSFYKEQLEKDIRDFLAPWAVGVFDKLRFGECLNKSDLVYFLETREYVDYITLLQLQGEFDAELSLYDRTEICPRTPRSILLAGDIQICIEDGGQEVWTAADCKQPVAVMHADIKQATIPI